MSWFGGLITLIAGPAWFGQRDLIGPIGRFASIDELLQSTAEARIEHQPSQACKHAFVFQRKALRKDKLRSSIGAFRAAGMKALGERPGSTQYDHQGKPQSDHDEASRV